MTEHEEFIYLWDRHPELHEMILGILIENAPDPEPKVSRQTTNSPEYQLFDNI